MEIINKLHKISLGDFIEQVKAELVQSQNKTGDPFFQLDAVELEVTFTVEATGDAKVKCFIELGGKASASQTHKVTLKLTPFVITKTDHIDTDDSTLGGKYFENFQKNKFSRTGVIPPTYIKKLDKPLFDVGHVPPLYYATPVIIKDTGLVKPELTTNKEDMRKARVKNITKRNKQSNSVANRRTRIKIKPK